MKTQDSPINGQRINNNNNNNINVDVKMEKSRARKTTKRKSNSWIKKLLVGAIIALLVSAYSYYIEQDGFKDHSTELSK